MIEPLNPYNDFGEMLSKHFDFKVQKISINAGFTCPNRDGLKDRGGCTYCNNQSFSPEYKIKSRSVSEQLKQGIEFFSHKYPTMKYLAYFQSYTNTYADISKLTALYEEALAYPGVVGIIIGTRPDCVNDELLDYFEALNKRTYLMIEYGVESTLNRTLDLINRGHTYEESVEAINKTAAKGIKVGIHMILGLPKESRDEILSHADKISQLPIDTVKLHQLQLIRGTVMAREYAEHPEWFNLFTLDEYVDFCVAFAERLNPHFTIERFTSQSPKSLLIAPDWGSKNAEIVVKIRKRFIEKQTWQGKLYQP